MVNDLKHLEEIESRIQMGWRLKEDMDWLIEFVKRVLNDKQ